MDYVYSDFSLLFKKHPFTGDVLTRYDVDSVKQALTVLFLTNRYEKKFDPNFGIGVSGMLFDMVTPITKISLLKRIRNQCDFYEPRVVIHNIDISDIADDNAITIDFYFSILDNPNNVETLTLSFNRLR